MPQKPVRPKLMHWWLCREPYAAMARISCGITSWRRLTLDKCDVCCAAVALAHCLPFACVPTMVLRRSTWTDSTLGSAEDLDLYSEVREQARNTLFRGTLRMSLQSHCDAITRPIQRLIFNAYGVWDAYGSAPYSVYATVLMHCTPSPKN